MCGKLIVEMIALAALLDIIAQHEGQTVIVVSHGGWIHAVITSCVGLRSVPPIVNGSITTLRLAKNGAACMESDIDSSHVRSGVATLNPDVVMSQVSLESKG